MFLVETRLNKAKTEVNQKTYLSFFRILCLKLLRNENFIQV